MRATEVRKVVKDNGLNLTVRGRTNGMVYVELTENTNDIATLDELLNGFNYQLKKQYTGYLVNYKG
jgi:hypothetical protein